MKKLIPVFALVMLCFYSCKEETKKTKSKVVTPSERPITPPPDFNTLTGVVGGAHYICPQNCVGGTSSAQGTCPVCSTALAHNQGFHNTPNITTPTTTNPAVTNSAATPAPGPNLAGQYHYTCTNGCAGGGDTVGKCSSCAGDLTHNQAFHI
ncbi:MAG: hypothetical protein COA67_05065 [Lutibacter sp.]|nr:MAG: hypothetical protein COA67_05065 [Lutibacter sp.]